MFMTRFRELTQCALGPSTVVTGSRGVIVTAPHAVVLASELVRVTDEMKRELPSGSVLITKLHTFEDDRYSNRLVEGVTLYILLPR